MCDAYQMLVNKDMNPSTQNMSKIQRISHALVELQIACLFLQDNLDWVLDPIIQCTLELTIKNVAEFLHFHNLLDSGHRTRPLQSHVKCAEEITVVCNYLLESNSTFLQELADENMNMD
jgi:hypothetical protein